MIHFSTFLGLSGRLHVCPDFGREIKKQILKIIFLPCSKWPRGGLPKKYGAAYLKSIRLGGLGGPNPPAKRIFKICFSRMFGPTRPSEQLLLFFITFNIHENMLIGEWSWRQPLEKTDLDDLFFWEVLSTLTSQTNGFLMGCLSNSICLAAPWPIRAMSKIDFQSLFFHVPAKIGLDM